MFTKEYQFICDSVLNLVECTFDGDISLEEFDGVSVKFDGKNAIIGCNAKNTFARGVFLLAMENKGKPFEIKQKPHFAYLLPSIDVSRNGVYTIPALKEYLLKCAALGYSHFTLYIEDVIEMEGYPRFGYMRGRYTMDDMRELVAYGKQIGLEMIPKFQSLGHMEQYLQWAESAPIRDTSHCLLVDEPKTYEFLDQAYAMMRSLTDSKYLFVCLDETHDLGTGQYEALHGKQVRKDIFMKHARKVFDLCNKYDFIPVMDSDMFFRMKSKHGWYHDPDVVIDESDTEGFPENMGVVYWDYYQTEKHLYDLYLDQHKNFNREIIVFGSIWTWEGFTEDTHFTWETSIPMMQSCLERGIRIFVVAMFGDRGCECSDLRSDSSLAIFSEYSYRGLDCTKEDIFKVSEFLTKMPYQHRFDLGKIHSQYHSDYRLASKYLYGDIFYDLANIPYDIDVVKADFAFALEAAEKCRKIGGRYADFYEYYYYHNKVVHDKFHLTKDVRAAYEAKDMEALRHIAQVRIPETISDLVTFRKLHQKEWLRDRKPNGLEVINIRLGGVAAQLEWQAEYLMDYVEGRIPEITMLEEKIIQDQHKVWHSKVFTPSMWTP